MRKDILERLEELFSSRAEHARPDIKLVSSYYYDNEGHLSDLENYIYVKKFSCPVCGKDFSANLVKESKLRITSVEFDLRPVCSPIDPNLYDVILCPNCGYCDARNNFGNISHRQIEAVLEKVSHNFVCREYPDILDIDMALEKYEQALYCSLVKNARDGEIAYICLKIMWLYKSKGDEMQQKLFAELTLKCFEIALASERLPIMGLEGDTITYLIGSLYWLLDDKQSALRLLSGLVVSKSASARLKDRARDLKDIIIASEKEV